jgi:peptide/nickel transport system substrate-binding protein
MPSSPSARSARSTTLLATAALLPVLLAGCSEGGGADTSGADVSSLTVGLSQNPETLDPAATGLIGAVKVDAQIFDTLIYRFQGSSQWTPGLATDLAINADATEYTFTLRKDVTFHDGTPFNAAAVKATFDHVVDPATHSLSAVSALGPYTETQVVDDYTAKVVFSAPNPSFATQAAEPVLGISSPTALQEYGADYGQHPVGTGPFVFTSFTSDSEVKLTRNDDYTWGPAEYGAGPAKIKDLTFRILSDPSAQTNALTTGEIRLADGMSTQDISTAESSGKKVTSAPISGMPYGYLLNTTTSPTDDTLVRQAVMHAVDRKSIVDTLFDGQYELATSVVTKGTSGYVDGGDQYSYDPKLAASLLDQAGWTAGSEGKRSKNGQPLTIKMIDIADYGFDGMSPLIQAQLAKVGITADLSAQAFPTVATTYNGGSQNTASWFFSSVDPNMVKSVFTCDQVASGFNWSHFCDPAMDAAIAAADSTPDPQARVSAFSDVFTELNAQALFLPIYDIQSTVVTADGVSGLLFNVDGNPVYAAVGK